MMPRLPSFILFFALLTFSLCFFKTQAKIPPYKELFYEQQVDHFNYYSTPATFKQRYLVNSGWWDAAEGSIFLYTGNEGDIQYFWESCGWMFELAPEFGAYVIFIEHRYYGESWPVSSDIAFENGNQRFLSAEQALADFAVIIEDLQAELASIAGASSPYRRYPVFAFGGSYGGMLSGWFRLQYPYLVDAALASSAPIPMASLPQRRNSDNYWKVITDAYAEMSKDCPTLVRQGFSEILSNTGNTKGYQSLSSKFKLCEPIQNDDDLEELVLWIVDAYSSLAMGNYPTPHGNLPAWPLNETCKIMLANSNDPLQGLVNVADFFWNDSRTCNDMYADYVVCADITGCGTGPEGNSWDYQACSEMIYYPAMNNITDMFPPFEWNQKIHSQYCYDRFGIESRLEWTAISLGGSAEDFKSTSRIIFSNGGVDPWSSGGFLEPIDQINLPLVWIPSGGHHVDLRSSDPADPEPIVAARQQEKDILWNWFLQIKQELAK